MSGPCWAYVGPILGLCWTIFCLWGLCWGHVEPMLSPFWAKNRDHVGLCSAIFHSDLRKIRSGLKNTAVFGSCRGHVGPMWNLCWPSVGPCWALGGHVGAMLNYVEPMLGQERRVHLSHCEGAQMNTLFLGHVGAMLGLFWILSSYLLFICCFYFVASGTK